jgi:nicotinamide phosphoribosyltransferase
MLDGYKTGHKNQYPNNTEYIYSNSTPRSSRLENVDRVVNFGYQYFVREWLLNRFECDFFLENKNVVLNKYKRRMDGYLGKDKLDVGHIADLHDLGYLPLYIKTLEEGTVSPVGVPNLTITNTLPEFFWLVNYLETLISCELWPMITSATMAYQYRKNFNVFPGLDPSMIKFMGHDFSMRVMFGHHAPIISGAAHLTSFAGTDTVPAIDFIEEYYGNNLPDNYLIGCTIPATEHSVMCAGGEDDEIGTWRRLLTEVYPTGPVAIVSDTWDFWNTVTVIVEELKDVILGRDGKVVVRPDSGDPVKVICGDPSATEGSPEYKGAYHCLYDNFPGVSTNGLRKLNAKVGLIYGDSITLDRQLAIKDGLVKKGFCPDVILGIGSFTYQYTTRDTFGQAIKATWGKFGGVDKAMFKSPKGDSKKNSAKGLLRVNNDYTLTENCSYVEEQGGLLLPLFKDGRMLRETNLHKIRQKLHGDTF